MECGIITWNKIQKEEPAVRIQMGQEAFSIKKIATQHFNYEITAALYLRFIARLKHDNY